MENKKDLEKEMTIQNHKILTELLIRMNSLEMLLIEKGLISNSEYEKKVDEGARVFQEQIKKKLNNE